MRMYKHIFRTQDTQGAKRIAKHTDVQCTTFLFDVYCKFMYVLEWMRAMTAKPSSCDTQKKKKFEVCAVSCSYYTNFVLSLIALNVGTNNIIDSSNSHQML